MKKMLPVMMISYPLKVCPENECYFKKDAMIQNLYKGKYSNKI